VSDSSRRVLALILAAVAFGWWLGVEVWRGSTQEHSARAFWLHLTAPLVAIVLLLAAIWLLVNTEKLRRIRGVAPNAALRPAPAKPLVILHRNSGADSRDYRHSSASYIDRVAESVVPKLTGTCTQRSTAPSTRPPR
jgi:hypothetical protein